MAVDVSVNGRYQPFGMTRVLGQAHGAFNGRTVGTGDGSGGTLTIRIILQGMASRVFMIRGFFAEVVATTGVVVRCELFPSFYTGNIVRLAAETLPNGAIVSGITREMKILWETNDPSNLSFAAMVLTNTNALEARFSVWGEYWEHRRLQQEGFGHVPSY